MVQIPATPTLDTGNPADADVLLRALAGICADLGQVYDALEGRDLDPAQAALEVHLAERAARFSARGQLLAAAAANASRVITLDPETLKAVDAIAADPAPFAAGTVNMPAPTTGKSPRKMLFRDTADYYRERLHLGGAETARRLAGARLLTPRPGPGSAAPGAARYPRMAEAARDGSADVGHLVDYAKRLDTLQPTIDQRPDAADFTDAVEASLAEAARTQEANGGKKIIKAWEEYLDASETPPSAAELRARQGIFYLGQHRGLHEWMLRCTPMQYETMETFFDAADNQRSAKAAVFRAGGGAAAQGGQHATAARGQAVAPDPRQAFHGGQSTLDSLVDEDTGTDRASDPVSGEGWQTDEDRAPAWACDPDLPEDQRPVGDFPTHETVPPQDDDSSWPTRAQRRLEYLATGCANTFNPAGSTGAALNAQVVVHIDFQTLLGQLNRSGTTNHGVSIDAENIRQLACRAKILPIVFGGDNEILNIGRQSRFFTRAQRDAVLAREGGGCFRPGCAMPAHTLQLHHVEPWSRGGETSVANALAACDHDHHLLHTGALKATMDNGVPHLVTADPATANRSNLYWHPGDVLAGRVPEDHGFRVGRYSGSPPVGPGS